MVLKLTISAILLGLGICLSGCAVKGEILYYGKTALDHQDFSPKMEAMQNGHYSKN